MSLPDASPARAIELCDQLRSVATELRNVLVSLGAEPAGLVLRAPEPVPLGKALSRVDAARKCGVSLSTFDTHVRPFIPSNKVGAHPRFLESDLDDWLSRQEPTKSPAGRKLPTRRGRRHTTETVLDPKALAILNRIKSGGKARV